MNLPTNFVFMLIFATLNNNNNDHVAKVAHWKLCEKYHLEQKDKWYEHTPNSVSENDEVKLLWDINIQCDHVIETRRPDIVVVNKQRHY